MSASALRQVEAEMGRHPEIDWPVVLRKTVKAKVGEMQRMRVTLLALNKLLGKSRLSEKDAIRLGRKVNESVYRKLAGEGLL